MQKKILCHLIYIVVIVILIIGAFLVGYKKGIQISQLSAPETSKVIQSRYVTALGEITAISGHIITIIKDGETFSINLREDVRITTFFYNKNIKGETILEPKNIKLEEIKIGDNVLAQIEIKTNNIYEGVALTIFNSPAPSLQNINY